jgi:hypothetical protein
VRRARTLAAVAAVVITAAACRSTSHGTAASEQVSPKPATPIPAAVRAKEYVAITFTDVAMTTAGAPVVRLRFVAKNNGSDPVLCDESQFSLQLANGTTLAADPGANNVCDPDTIDPGATSNIVMFFDLPAGYAGSVTLIMRSPSNVPVGQAETTLH